LKSAVITMEKTSRQMTYDALNPKCEYRPAVAKGYGGQESETNPKLQ